MSRAKSIMFLSWLLAISAAMLEAQNVITDWNTVASTTIVKLGGKASGAGSVWFAYAAIASYDAVNAIQGQFQPFYYGRGLRTELRRKRPQSQPPIACW